MHKMNEDFQKRNRDSINLKYEKTTFNGDVPHSIWYLVTDGGDGHRGGRIRMKRDIKRSKVFSKSTFPIPDHIMWLWD